MSDLEAQARKIAQSMARLVDEAVKITTLEIQYELKRSTPVDTGHARSNWVPSVGAPARGEEPGSGGAAQAAGEASIAGYKATAGSAYISNNVPYIQRLDQGHSLQAPTGFVRQSVTRGTRKAQAKINARAKRL